MERIEVKKTWKMFVGGAFIRSEGGRVAAVRARAGKSRNGEGEFLGNVCMATRKDLRNAVEAAEKAVPGWGGRSPFNRGQILYRLAEMMESRVDELGAVLRESAGYSRPAARREVTATIDRTVYYAGWADKYEQVLGNTNPVASPYFNFSVTEPMGAIAVIAGDEAPLLGLLSQALPAITGGNTVVALASEKYPVPAAVLGEILAVSDFPAGVINLLTGERADLLDTFASHAQIRGIDFALPAEEAVTIERGAAEHIKRCKARPLWTAREWLSQDRESPYEIRDFVELKTVWHPYWV